MIQLTDSIKNSKKFQTVKTIVNKLKSNGHAAFIVGGAVRDLYLKKSPEEFDIATSATPDEIQSVFEHTKPVGQSFGVVLVIVSNFSFEVATFRKDMKYEDGRHPINVIYTKSQKEDVKRRDFTINGLMLDPQ